MTYEICQRTGEGPCPSDLSREKSKVALSYVVRALTIVVCCLVLGASQSLAEQPQPFNVLFIAADDLRTDLGCYGHPQVKTPHLDRLAQRGLLFEHAYCQQAVCNPSRASILTGRHVDSLRIWDLKTHFRETTKNAVTLPEHFKNQGYFTQNVGKIFAIGFIRFRAIRSPGVCQLNYISPVMEPTSRSGIKQISPYRIISHATRNVNVATYPMRRTLMAA